MTTLIKRTLTGIIFGIAFWAIYIYLAPIYFSAFLVGIAAIIVMFEWTKFLDPSLSTFWVTLPLYPVLPFVLLVYLNHSYVYRDLLLILFIVAFSFDTGSYLVGKTIGRHKICPKISPNKTWEGVIGGFIFAAIGMELALWEHGGMRPFVPVAAVTVGLCLLLLIGDLFESYLKRRAELKDSGTMLPGHGGFLDRFDGILFAAYFIFLLRVYLINFLN